MNNTLIDNSINLKMVDMLKQCISAPTCKIIKIATGYWDIPGLSLVRNELKAFLEKEGTEFQLLIGTDPLIRATQIKIPKYKGKQFPEDFIKIDIKELDVKPEYKDAIKLLLDYCKAEETESKIKIRIYRTDNQGDAQFLHAKCYIFKGDENSIGIIGSSNFTQKGLEGNAELNYVETNGMIVTHVPIDGAKMKGHIAWFDEKWKISQPWNGQFLEQVLKPSPNAKKIMEERKITEWELTPYLLYMKYLQTQFGEILDPSANATLKSYLPPQYKAYEYQLDAVKQCFSIMQKYNGFILGDVVGLGKTIVGVLIIKKFLSEASRYGRPSKVLIVIPPSIKHNWVKTIEDFDQYNEIKIGNDIDFITTGSIVNLIDTEHEIMEDTSEAFSDDFRKEPYGLVLVDESHNFRNSGTEKYKQLDELIGTTVPHPFVGLLSATPQNNSPEDIKNQIYLFIREPNLCSLPHIEGGKLDSFFNEMRKKFNDARNDSNEEEQKERVKKIAEEIRFRVLNDLVVRRTRSDIKHRYLQDSHDLNFPIVKGPNTFKYEMTGSLLTLFADTVDAICPDIDNEGNSLFDSNKNIGFYRYAAITYFINNDNKKLYEKKNLTVERITKQLANIMRIMLVKRLESSFSAFKTTLINLRNYTDMMTEMLNKGHIYICPDIDVSKIYQKANKANGKFKNFCMEMDRQINRKGGNNRCFQDSDFNSEKYLQDLKHDHDRISELVDRWEQISKDPKYDMFRQKIPILFDPKINNPSGKNKPRLIIFTEAISTLDAIEEALTDKGHKVLKVTSNNRNNLQKTIYQNFDANAPIGDQRDEYDCLITTDVLAEGINLHRANVILNYDTPWNATRLMQRIGRINRIGSPEKNVYVFNFYPSTAGNNYIKLKEKAYAKLQSFHTMFGEDNKVFTDREEITNSTLTQSIEDDENPFNIYICDLVQFQKEAPTCYQHLLQIPLNKVGGKIVNGKGVEVIGVSDSLHGLISMKINRNDLYIISPLETMAALRCEPTAQFDSKFSNKEIKILFDKALMTYHDHIYNSVTAKDATKKIRQALQVIGKLRKAYLKKLSTDNKKLIMQVEKSIHRNNKDVINNTLQLGKRLSYGGESFFGINNDINQWIHNTYNFAAKQTSKKITKPSITFYELK